MMFNKPLSFLPAFIGLIMIFLPVQNLMAEPLSKEEISKLAGVDLSSNSELSVKGRGNDSNIQTALNEKEVTTLSEKAITDDCSDMNQLGSQYSEVSDTEVVVAIIVVLSTFIYIFTKIQ